MRKQSFFNFIFGNKSLLALFILVPFVFGCSLFGIDTKRNGKTPRGQQEEETGLVGTWKNAKATLRFNADGMMTINGTKYRYKATDTIIKLTGHDGSADIPYTLDGDTLTISYQGQNAVYQRVKKKVGGDAGGDVAQELVGKWCYFSNTKTNDGGYMSDRCIMLNGDGTYEYYSETSITGDRGDTGSQNSDSGTWTATEDTITANSNTQGTRAYSLEKQNHPKTGDPMIVLDGEPYVTYNQRAPW